MSEESRAQERDEDMAQLQREKEETERVLATVKAKNAKLDKMLEKMLEKKMTSNSGLCGVRMCKNSFLNFLGCILY